MQYAKDLNTAAIDTMMDPPDEVASDGESVEMGIDADNNEKSTKKVGWSVAEKNDVEAGEDVVDEQEKAPPGGITYCDHYSLQYPSSTVRFRTSAGKRVLYLNGNTVAFLSSCHFVSHNQHSPSSLLLYSIASSL